MATFSPILLLPVYYTSVSLYFALSLFFTLALLSRSSHFLYIVLPSRRSSSIIFYPSLIFSCLYFSKFLKYPAFGALFQRIYTIAENISRINSINYNNVWLSSSRRKLRYHSAACYFHVFLYIRNSRSCGVLYMPPLIFVRTRSYLLFADYARGSLPLLAQFSSCLGAARAVVASLTYSSVFHNLTSTSCFPLRRCCLWCSNWMLLYTWIIFVKKNIVFYDQWCCCFYCFNYFF